MNSIRKNANPKLISIIIPVFNAEISLDTCVKSVLSQTYKNFELLLIDDGSTDTSGERCSQYAKKDSRITVLQQKNNGPASTRNTGIRNSKGEFIFFLDADDFLEPDALENLFQAHTQNKTDITIGDFRKIGKNILSSGHNNFFSGDTLMNRQQILDYVNQYIQTPYVHILFVHCWGKLYLSEIIKNNELFFNPELHNFEDVDFNFRYLNYANTVFFLNKILYNYQLPIKQLTQSFRIGHNIEHVNNYVHAFHSVRKFLEKNAPHIEAKKRVSHLYVSCMIITLIRTCGQLNTQNKKAVYALVKNITNNENVQNSLPFYTPTKKDSRLLANLVKLKLSWLLMHVAKLKYKKHRRSQILNTKVLHNGNEHTVNHSSVN